MLQTYLSTNQSFSSMTSTAFTKQDASSPLYLVVPITSTGLLDTSRLERVHTFMTETMPTLDQPPKSNLVPNEFEALTTNAILCYPLSDGLFSFSRMLPKSATPSKTYFKF